MNLQTFFDTGFTRINALFSSGEINTAVANHLASEFKALKTSAESMMLRGDSPITAHEILQRAAGHMDDRASSYDAPQGERSMSKVIAAFNVITGLNLTEEQGWLLMVLLKITRSQQGNYKPDNYEDGSAYFALQGECASRDRGKKFLFNPTIKETNHELNIATNPANSNGIHNEQLAS